MTESIRAFTAFLDAQACQPRLELNQRLMAFTPKHGLAFLQPGLEFRHQCDELPHAFLRGQGAQQAGLLGVDRVPILEDKCQAGALTF